MNISLQITSGEMRKVAEELGLKVNPLMSFVELRSLVLEADEVYASDRFQQIIKDSGKRSERDFYLRATVHDLRELAEEMDLKVDSKLPRNALQELILKEDRIYALERITWIIEDRQDMERNEKIEQEWEERKEFLKRLEFGIKTKPDLRKSGVQSPELSSKPQQDAYEAKQLPTKCQTISEETEIQVPDSQFRVIQSQSENMSSVSAEPDDRVPVFLQSQIDETILNNVNPEMKRMPSLSALQVNTPCEKKNVGTSSDALNVDLLIELALDDIIKSNGDLEVISCESCEDGQWMFGLCRSHHGHAKHKMDELNSEMESLPSINALEVNMPCEEKNVKASPDTLKLIELDDITNSKGKLEVDSCESCKDGMLVFDLCRSHHGRTKHKKDELNSEMESLPSISALEVNMLCEETNVKTSSDALKSMELDDVTNSKDFLEVISCELSKDGFSMFSLCRSDYIRMLCFRLIGEKHQSRGFSPTFLP